LEKLAAENYLVNLDAALFAGRAAYYLGEVNAAHPFREGNGRTQREFIRELGLKAGHYIDWRATTIEEMTHASRSSHVTGEGRDFWLFRAGTLQTHDAVRQ
jgi:cell filamentation protein